MKIKNNFLSKLHMGCSEEPILEKLNLIHFKNKKAYCTNGHIAIIQDLDLHSLSEECIDNLEGKFIHQITFKNLLSYSEVYFRPENIVALTEFKTEVIFNYYLFEDKWVDVDSVFEGFTMNQIDEIGINPILIKKANECLIKSSHCGLHFRFNEKNKGFIVTSIDHNADKQRALLMPAIIQI